MIQIWKVLERFLNRSPIGWDRDDRALPPAFAPMTFSISHLPWFAVVLCNKVNSGNPLPSSVYCLLSPPKHRARYSLEFGFGTEGDLNWARRCECSVFTRAYVSPQFFCFFWPIGVGTIPGKPHPCLFEVILMNLSAEMNAASL